MYIVIPIVKNLFLVLVNCSYVLLWNIKIEVNRIFVKQAIILFTCTLLYVLIASTIICPNHDGAVFLVRRISAFLSTCLDTSMWSLDGSCVTVWTSSLIGWRLFNHLHI